MKEIRLNKTDLKRYMSRVFHQKVSLNNCKDCIFYKNEHCCRNRTDFHIPKKRTINIGCSNYRFNEEKEKV